MNNKLAAIGLFLFILISFVFLHESTHKFIYERAGCDASINANPLAEINLENSFFMSCSFDCSNLSDKEVNQVNNQQAMVEAVGYQLFPVYGLLAFLFIMFSQTRSKP